MFAFVTFEYQENYERMINMLKNRKEEGQTGKELQQGEEKDKCDIKKSAKGLTMMNINLHWDPAKEPSNLLWTNLCNSQFKIMRNKIIVYFLLLCVITGLVFLFQFLNTNIISASKKYPETRNCDSFE